MNLTSAVQQEWRNPKITPSYWHNRHVLFHLRHLQVPPSCSVTMTPWKAYLLYTRICWYISPVLRILFIWLYTQKLYLFCLPFSAVTVCQNHYSSLWYLWLKESLLVIRRPSAQCHWVLTHSHCLSSEILHFSEWILMPLHPSSTFPEQEDC